MRISTHQFYQRALDAILDQQSNLSQTQLQISTGRRILAPSDDPIGSTRILDIEQTLERVRQYRVNGDQVRAGLELEEGTLGRVTDLLQRVRELAVQGNNDTYNNDGRKALGTEVRARLEELTALANTRNANGEHIFAGFQDRVQPFVRDASGAVTYVGDQGQRLTQVGAGTTVAAGDPGSAVFMAVRNGNGTFATAHAAGNTGTGIIDNGSVTNLAAWVPDTYTIRFTSATTYEVRNSAAVLVTGGTYQSGTTIAFNGIQTTLTGDPATGDQFTVRPSSHRSVFATFKSLADTLINGTTGTASLAGFHNLMNRALGELDQSLAAVGEFRAAAGSRLAVIETQDGLHQDLLLQLESARSEIGDLDYAEAISRLNRQQIALEAAQQTYVRVAGLSLFNFLR
jgi:flagellar hook-associated protein 3 FlgL